LHGLRFSSSLGGPEPSDVSHPYILIVCSSDAGRPPATSGSREAKSQGPTGGLVRGSLGEEASASLQGPRLP
ncbi:hypothetical protein NPIL_299741, partial [Nephila pilipes]